MVLLTWLALAFLCGLIVCQPEDKRAQRLLATLRSSEVLTSSFEFVKETWSPDHRRGSQAIFALAMYNTMGRIGAKRFVGTARKGGFEGDIVIGILPDSLPRFVEALKEDKAIVYTLDLDCEGISNTRVCGFKHRPGVKVSMNMIRYYMYQYFGSKYDSSSLIMVSDFLDVLFQANPFTYKHPTFKWDPKINQIAVFLENYPNKVIYRCPYNSGWIKGCYGDRSVEKIGSNTISCSGVTMGSRDAIVVYSFLMTQQLDPRARYGRNSTLTNEGCISLGMDQGFHNWLIYSGLLSKYMEVQVFHQGEGAVNTIGGMHGPRKVVPFTLSEWNILRGAAPNKKIYNWNGDISPVVHQADRYLADELAPTYKEHLFAAQNID